MTTATHFTRNEVACSAELDFSPTGGLPPGFPTVPTTAAVSPLLVPTSLASFSCAIPKLNSQRWSQHSAAPRSTPILLLGHASTPDGEVTHCLTCKIPRGLASFFCIGCTRTSDAFPVSDSACMSCCCAAVADADALLAAPGTAGSFLPRQHLGLFLDIPYLRGPITGGTGSRHVLPRSCLRRVALQLVLDPWPLPSLAPLRLLGPLPFCAPSDGNTTSCTCVGCEPMY